MSSNMSFRNPAAGNPAFGPIPVTVNGSNVEIVGNVINPGNFESVQYAQHISHILRLIIRTP